MGRSRSRSRSREDRSMTRNRRKSRSRSRDRSRNRSRDRCRSSRRKSKSVSPPNYAGNSDINMNYEIRLHWIFCADRSVGYRGRPADNNKFKEFRGRPADNDKFKEFRGRPSDGGFGPRGGKRGGVQNAYSEEYFDHRRSEREKIGTNGVPDAWSHSPVRMTWPDDLVDLLGVKKKDRKGSSGDSDSSDAGKKRKKSKKSKKKSEKKKKVSTWSLKLLIQ